MQTVVRTLLRATVYQLVRRLGLRYTVALGVGAFALLVTVEGVWAAELDYVERTSNLTVTATAEGSADTVLTSNALSFDGTTKARFEVFLPSSYVEGSTASLIYNLWDGSTNLGRLALHQKDANTGNESQPILATRYLTPSSGSHTYTVRAWGTGTAKAVNAGGSGSGTLNPAYLRVSDEAGGGGASALDDLSDVDLTGRADNSILKWDSSDAMWEMAADAEGAGGSGGTVALSDDDRNRLDLNWWGIWALVGLVLVLMIAPPMLSAMRVTRGMGA